MSDWDRYQLLGSEIGRLTAESQAAERRLADAHNRYDYATAGQEQRNLARLAPQTS
jgi:hypothetical protein